MAKDINKCLISMWCVGVCANIEISTHEIKLQYALWLKMKRNILCLLLFDTINFLLLIAVYYYVVIYSLSGDSSRDDISTAKPYWFSAKHSSWLAPGWTHLFFRKYQRHWALGRYIQLLSKQEADAAGVYRLYHKAVRKVVLQSFVKWVQGQFSFSVPVH